MEFSDKSKFLVPSTEIAPKTLLSYPTLNPKYLLNFHPRWTLLWFIGPILDNMRKAEEFLESQGDIDYSVILPAGLSNGQATNCDFLTEEDSFCIGGKGGMIQRADVARYMIKTMEEDLHHKKIVAIHPKS